MQQIINNNRSHEVLRPQGFVIHSTDTPGATAQNEFNYFNSAYRGASAHYFVDWIQILQTIPENEVAWHAGSTANHKFLSVEICEPLGNNASRFEEAWKRTVGLVAEGCVRYGWTVATQVFSHQEISSMYQETNHSDPIDYLGRYGRTWDDLLVAVEQEVQNIQGQNGGDIQLKNLILVGHGPDERAAGYLADFLKAPVAYLDAIQADDLNSAQNIYVIGGSVKPLERATLISGATRYDTCQKVIDFIHTGKL
ncbi:peptidoglycan recognition protein family protein [Desulfitobacterium metallireducens]|uniref:peptidoglycan recognition protein family protein n=1 Tax=Desulfitobacterium metallireducens TaxID=142877 RepID=UPI001FA724E8|nr:peptidoglycan recognition family protein [Desulfitobacterium metallireducens]